MAEEKVVYDEKLSMRIALFSQGFLSLLTFFYCGIGLIAAFLQSLSHRYRITSQRVVWTRGIISQRDEEIEFVRVKDTSFKQGILERIVKIGTVTVLSTDTSAPILTLRLTEPRKWREQIRDLVREEKERAGVGSVPRQLDRH